MKSFSLIIGLLLTMGLQAQTKAYPVTYGHVQLFTLLAPLEAYEVVGTRDLSKEYGNHEARIFSDRIEGLANWNSPKPYDAILTRDGIKVDYIRFKSMRNEPQGNLVNMHSSEVDMYFLSQPQRRYTVIGQKGIDSFNFSQPFVQLSKELLNEKFKVAYDAVIVGLDYVRYVIY